MLPSSQNSILILSNLEHRGVPIIGRSFGFGFSKFSAAYPVDAVLNEKDKNEKTTVTTS
jgi:hypothetical protein